LHLNPWRVAGIPWAVARTASVSRRNSRARA